jgi:hypothetical protein
MPGFARREQQSPLWQPFPGSWLCFALSRHHLAIFQVPLMFSIRWALFRIFHSCPTALPQAAIK